MAQTVGALENLLGSKLNHGQHLIFVDLQPRQSQFADELQLPDLLLAVGKAALLNDQGVQAQLHFGALDNALLNRALGNQAEHAHLLLLANAVRSVLRLQIHLRIPVAVGRVTEGRGCGCNPTCRRG